MYNNLDIMTLAFTYNGQLPVSMGRRSWKQYVAIVKNVV